MSVPDFEKIAQQFFTCSPAPDRRDCIGEHGPKCMTGRLIAALRAAYERGMKDGMDACAGRLEEMAAQVRELPPKERWHPAAKPTIMVTIEECAAAIRALIGGGEASDGK